MQAHQERIGERSAGPAAATAGRLLKAAPNFRDIGHLPTRDGRVVRPGLVFRSGALDELDAADLVTLRSIGVRLCLDLRSRGERQTSPSRWPEDRVPRTLALEVATDIRVLDRQLADWLADHPDREGAERLMRGIYRTMPASCAPVLNRLFEELTADHAGALPLVIHCAAGKDRTGFTVAMLLKALGVADQDIFADYLESNKHYDHARQDAKISALLQGMLGFALDADALQAVTRADHHYLACAFEEIEREYGSAERYLEIRAGLDADRRGRLQDALLASARA